MDHFAGLDVSVKETSICIVDDTGKIVREVTVASEPEALLAVLDSPRQQRTRATAQNFGERIGECPWLGELENVSLGHGVSLLRWRSGGGEHPHDTPPYPFMPSPTSAFSSG
jgi:hypothetical protein